MIASLDFPETEIEQFESANENRKLFSIFFGSAIRSPTRWRIHCHVEKFCITKLCKRGSGVGYRYLGQQLLRTFACKPVNWGRKFSELKFSETKYVYIVYRRGKELEKCFKFARLCRDVVAALAHTHTHILSLSLFLTFSPLRTPILNRRKFFAALALLPYIESE